MNQEKLKHRIRECEQQIDNLKTLPYYSIFKQEGQRKRDIEKAEKKLMRLYGDLVIRKTNADKAMSEASNNRIKQITESTLIKTSIKY